MKDQKASDRKPKSENNKKTMTPLQNNATLGREIQSRIGDQLRAMYDDVVRQGVPDRFADLIRKLDQPGAQGGGNTDKNDDGRN